MKRLISWVLCVAMILSLTTNVFALTTWDEEGIVLPPDAA